MPSTSGTKRSMSRFEGDGWLFMELEAMMGKEEFALEDGDAVAVDAAVAAVVVAAVVAAVVVVVEEIGVGEGLGDGVFMDGRAAVATASDRGTL